jgi:biopolymer transport protein ExbB
MDQIFSFLALGGPVVAILVALSMIAVAIILMKLVQFWRQGVGRHEMVRRALHAWHHGRHGEARVMLEGARSPLGVSLATTMRLVAGRSVAKGVIEEEVGRIALSRLHELQKGLRGLEAIAQIAPLLGLFGTVLGMIEAFQQLQGGIWVALLTTAVGLAVAMPVSLIHTFLDARIDNERVAIETMTTAILTGQEIGGSANWQRDTAIAGAMAHAH